MLSVIRGADSKTLVGHGTSSGILGTEGKYTRKRIVSANISFKFLKTYRQRCKNVDWTKMIVIQKYRR